MSFTMQDSIAQPEEVWVQVRRRKGRHSGKATTVHSITTPTPTPSLPSLSLDQVKQDHERLAGQWKSSPAYGQLQDLLSVAGAYPTVNQAICFGLGSFDPPDGAWDQKRKTHLQLAAFRAIVEHIQNKEGRQIHCIFQEPIFNSVDKEFVESLGHEVVESPVGFQLVNPNTLAFAIHLYRDIHSQVIATHVPALFIGTPYTVWEDFQRDEHSDWPRMKELDQLCCKVDFPNNKADYTFSNTSIHWRPEDPN